MCLIKKRCGEWGRGRGVVEQVGRFFGASGGAASDHRWPFSLPLSPNPLCAGFSGKWLWLSLDLCALHRFPQAGLEIGSILAAEWLGCVRLSGACCAT